MVIRQPIGRRVLLAILTSIPVILAGCGNHGPAAPPTTSNNPPPPGISGQVTITARLTDAQGAVTGTRALVNADGVSVHLFKPDGTLDSTLTQAGRYVFPVSAAGIYRVKAWVSPLDTVSSGDLSFSAGDSLVAPALEIPSSGDLSTFPNPFPAAEGLAIELNLAGPLQRYELVALNLAGVPVWSYAYDNGLPGHYHIHWMGIDNAVPTPNPVPNGSYWIRGRFNGRDHYNLIFKQ